MAYVDPQAVHWASHKSAPAIPDRGQIELLMRANRPTVTCDLGRRNAPCELFLEIFVRPKSSTRRSVPFNPRITAFQRPQNCLGLPFMQNSPHGFE